MKIDKVASFRAPDPEFCDMFNNAMALTGLDINGLAVRSIRKGLRYAVSDVLKEREEAKEQWNKRFGGPTR